MELQTESVVTPRATMAIIAVLSLQLAMVAGTFHNPFCDTRYHYFYDNAWFTTAARNANQIGFPANRAGVVIRLPHERWHEPSGAPEFYTHHPYLMKLIMQQLMACCGHDEWVSRVFSLGVSMIATTGMLVTLTWLTGSLACGVLAAVVFIGLPVMAVYQTCVKFEIDGLAASAWLFPAILLYAGRPSLKRGLLLAACGLVCGLSSWTGMMFTFLTCALLRLAPLITGQGAFVASQTRAATWLAGGLAAAGLSLLAAFMWQQGGAASFASDLISVFLVHADGSPFTARQWTSRQADYLARNYGVTGLALLLAAVAGIMPRWATRLQRPTGAAVNDHPGLLTGFVFVSLATALIWVGVFREGSYVHEYWSLPLCMPIAAALPMWISRLAGSRRTAALLVGMVLAALVVTTGWQGLSERLKQMCDPSRTADIAFLKSLRHERCAEFVYVPLVDDASQHWFHPRLFEYYTDRTLRFLGKDEELRPNQKIILLRFTDQAQVEALIEKQAGVGLANRLCGPRFCAYDVIARDDIARP